MTDKIEVGQVWQDKECPEYTIMVVNIDAAVGSIFLGGRGHNISEETLLRNYTLYRHADGRLASTANESSGDVTVLCKKDRYTCEHPKCDCPETPTAHSNDRTAGAGDSEPPAESETPPKMRPIYGDCGGYDFYASQPPANAPGELTESVAINLYNEGYKAGHDDTVESRYTDIYPIDMQIVHADIVAELLADIAPPPPSDAELQALRDEVDRYRKRMERLYQVIGYHGFHRISSFTNEQLSEWFDPNGKVKPLAEKEAGCVWTRHGSVATEQWVDTGCGMKDVDVEPLYQDMPLNYCQNCGKSIVEQEAGCEG